MIKKIVNLYNSLEKNLLVISLGVTVLLVFIQIFMRWVLNSSLTWSEELVRYIFIWQIWLGTSVGFRDDKHIKLEIVSSRLKGKSLAVYDIIGTLIVIAFSAFLIYTGMQLVARFISTNYLSASLRLPLYLVYLSLPFSSFVVILRLLGKVIKNIKLILGIPVCDPELKEGT